MRKLLAATVALTALAALSACGQENSRREQAEMAPPPSPPPMVEGYVGGSDRMARSEANFAAVDGASPSDGGEPRTMEQMAEDGALLAYRYDVQMTLPTDSVRATMDAHVEACRAAGPSVCQLLNANISETGTDYVHASLRLRAEPGWLTSLRAGLSDDAEEAGGRITSSNVTAEDLTAAITDTQAMLAARIALRDRLMEILETQPGEMSDLLAVERQIADVQGQIDSRQSQLEMMRRRVEMSHLNLTYISQREVLRPSAFNPLGEAIQNFFGYASETLAFMIRLLGYLLPALVVLVPLGWLGLRWRRRRRARTQTQA